LNSNEKALQILLAFTPDNRPLRTVEISNKLKINNATANRILITLKNNGFVVQDLATRRYRLGPSVALLGRAVRQSLKGKLVGLAKPHLQNLRDKTGETVNIEVLYDDRILLVYCAKGTRNVIATPRVGDRMEIHVNAGAKVIMAFCSEEIIDQHLTKPLIAYTNKTVTDSEKIRKEYEEIRTTGLAYDRGEYDDDVHAVAAPIFNHENVVVASVVIVTPSFRMNGSIESGLLESLKNTATAISNSLSEL